MANHLAGETSPYLLQHVSNPVDWYPWGPEALERAKAEDKPIFLSIGYSSCHWCHVMAHESFENEGVAGIINAHFVAIKVDREERPDLDRIYMAAVQALVGTGGWPMSVFMTPEGKPFYGGTYFPLVGREGLPAFTEVLWAVAEAWERRRQEVAETAEQVMAAMRRSLLPTLAVPANAPPLQRATLDAAAERLVAQYDHEHGGWGNAPKFPQALALAFLLRRYQRNQDPLLLAIVTQTLDVMARGGIYDQLGGGFHRYAMDVHWLMPHFEKMLYDNALLARVYLRGWQATGHAFYRTIAEEIIDYVLREMTDPAGGFYSSQDADSEGEEGKFFLWTAEQVKAELGEDAARFAAAYGITARGNYRHRNILSLVGTSEERAALAEERRRLGAVREKRVHPGRDEKVLASWNGLMLGTLAEAAVTWGREDYRQAAERNAAFLLGALRTPAGRLLHTWRGGQARLNGYLEDYTHLSDGLLALYRVSQDAQWLAAAQELVEVVIRHFGAPEGFYDTSDDHEALILRPRELEDNAIPSGNAMAIRVLLDLAHLTGQGRFRQLAEHALEVMQPLIGQYPLGLGQWLNALDEAMM